MNKCFSTLLAGIFSLSSHAALASQGEYWEMTTKTEMEGMPFSMPAQTIKVCVDKAQGTDPRKFNKDKDCQYSDVKISGNKSSWKVRCDHNGEVTTGSGESTIINEHSMEGSMRMSTNSGGKTMNMTMKQSSKYVGGSCDPEQLAKESEERRNKVMRENEERQKKECDTSAYTTELWIKNSWKYLHNNRSCPPGDQQKQMCAAINKDAPRDINIFTKVIDDKDLVAACGINVAATTKSVCKTYDAKNYLFDKYCPAEAKAYREAQRRKDCEGREYTAETRAADLKKCLNGKGDSADNEEATSIVPAKKSKPDENAEKSDSGNTTSTNVLEGAKKLKGLLGF